MTSILTIGNFDGLHLGHRHLISTTIQMARQWDARAVAMTFTPHPRQFFNPVDHFFIYPEHVKEQILETLGLDDVIYLPFGDIRTLTPEAFFNDILMPLDPVAIVLGANFTFGAHQAGNIDLLRRLCAGQNVALYSLAMTPFDGEPVSSSRIRAAIQSGDVRAAAQMLTIPYTLYGVVEHGAARGRTLGFPTANIHAPSQVMPKIGVYATRVQIDGAPREYQAVTAVTCTPTFGSVRTLVESHILDFDEDIYQRNIAVHFDRFIRDEMKFDSPEALIAQMRRDVDEVAIRNSQFAIRNSQFMHADF